MPENPNDLHVVGCADGEVWHTIRSPGRLAPAGKQWTGFTDVLAQSQRPAFVKGRAVDVACARRTAVPGLEDGLWVLIALSNRVPILMFRQSSGQWQQFNTEGLLDSRDTRRVAIGTVHRRPVPNDPNSDYEVLHIAFVNGDGSWWLVFGDANGPLTGPFNLDERAGGYGRVSAIALDSMFVFGEDPLTGPSPAESPLLAVFDQELGGGAKGPLAGSLGLMRYTLLVGPEFIGTIDGSPSTVRVEPWQVILPSPGTAAGLPPGSGTIVVDADLAMRSVVAATGRGGGRMAHLPGMALLAPDQVPNIREPNYVGIKPRWIDLEALNLPVNTFDVFGDLVPIDYGKFATISASLSADVRHFVGTTTDGRVLHQLRPLYANFGFFEDVETGVGQNVGTFTAVDCG